METKQTTYHCNDGNAEVKIQAASPEEAAQEYVDGGDWGESSKTRWVLVSVWTEDEDAERIRVEIEPSVPTCEHYEHVWVDHGVQGHGVGVLCTEVCPYCGTARITDTWAQCSATGEQGLRSVEYVEQYVHPIDVPDGWAVYRGSEAGCPKMHEAAEWYYEPSDWDVGEVYSEGYETAEEAADACREWVEIEGGDSRGVG